MPGGCYTRRVIASRVGGLSLLETVLAIGVLGFLIVTLGVLFTGFLRTSDKTGDLTVGLQLAEQILQETVNAKSFAYRPDTLMRLYTHDASQSGEFHYQVDVLPKTLTGGATTNAYYLDVQVWWSDPNTQSAGRGRQSVHLTRLVTP